MISWFLIGAALQIVIATASGAYAATKGRDGAVWFLIALAIGPISFLPLYLFDLPPDRKAD